MLFCTQDQVYQSRFCDTHSQSDSMVESGFLPRADTPAASFPPIKIENLQARVTFPSSNPSLKLHAMRCHSTFLRANTVLSRSGRGTRSRKRDVYRCCTNRLDMSTNPGETGSCGGYVQKSYRTLMNPISEAFSRKH